jgi:hypothetical protein
MALNSDLLARSDNAKGMKNCKTCFWAAVTISAAYLLHSQSSIASERAWVGEVTQICITARNTNVSGNATWYKVTNGCNEPVKVWIDNNGSGNYGSLMELRAGASDKSWYLNTKTNGIKLVGCKDKTGGRDVHLDKHSLRCYINR